MSTAYLAPQGFADQVQEELQRAGVAVVRRHERLFVCDGPAIAAADVSQQVGKAPTGTGRYRSRRFAAADYLA